MESSIRYCRTAGMDTYLFAILTVTNKHAMEVTQNSQLASIAAAVNDDDAAPVWTSI